MRTLQSFLDGLYSKPSKAASETPSSLSVNQLSEDPLVQGFVQQDEAEITQRALRESQIDFWMAEIKARERARAQELPLFYRLALKLRDATESRRLDEELRQELSVVLAQDEEDERERLSGLDSAVLESEALERIERDRLREEQEKAYLESLAADQEKEAAMLAQQQKETEEQECTKNFQRPSLAPEPPACSVDVANLVIRFPDGSRVQRRFSKDDRIQDVKNFVEYSRIDTSQQTLAELFLPTYTMFVLGAPPQSLTDLSATLEQAGLFPYPTLITVKVEK